MYIEKEKIRGEKTIWVIGIKGIVDKYDTILLSMLTAPFSNEYGLSCSTAIGSVSGVLTRYNP